MVPGAHEVSRSECNYNGWCTKWEPLENNQLEVDCHSWSGPFGKKLDFKGGVNFMQIIEVSLISLARCLSWWKDNPWVVVARYLWMCITRCGWVPGVVGNTTLVPKAGIAQPWVLCNTIRGSCTQQGAWRIFARRVDLKQKMGRLLTLIRRKQPLTQAQRR